MGGKRNRYPAGAVGWEAAMGLMSWEVAMGLMRWEAAVAAGGLRRETAGASWRVRG